jgi:hypothetical protein
MWCIELYGEATFNSSFCAKPAFAGEVAESTRSLYHFLPNKKAPLDKKGGDCEAVGGLHHPPFIQKIVGVLVSTNFASQSKFRPNQRLSRDFLDIHTAQK